LRINPVNRLGLHARLNSWYVWKSSFIW
jgi:hypothetical protein